MLRDRSVNKLLAMLTSSLERGIMFEKKGYFGYVCFLFFITVFEIISILFWFSLKILFLFEFNVLYVFYIFFRTKKRGSRHVASICFMFFKTVINYYRKGNFDREIRCTCLWFI